MATTKHSTSQSSNKEVWKSIPGFPGHEASSLGRIRSYWSRSGYHKEGHLEHEPHLLNFRCCLGKYPTTSIKGRNSPIAVHLLVLYAFVGPRPVIPGYKVEARHLNDVKTDNRAENLVWGTSRQN